MARSTTGSTQMDTTIAMRCTQSDKDQVRAYARSKGIDMSGLIRQIFVQQGVITPE